MEKFRGITSVTDEDRRNSVKEDNGFVYSADEKKLIGYAGCETKLFINEGVEVIANEVFARMDIETIKMPNTVTHVGAYAFQDCPNLRSVKLSDNIVHLGEGVFYGCQSLCKLSLPKGIRIINDYTFNNCNSLTEIVLPDGLVRIGEGTFRFCRVTKFSVPSTVIEIGNEAFCGCDWLIELHLPNSILSMGKDIIKDCPALKRIIITKGSRPRMEELLPEYVHLLIEGDS